MINANSDRKGKICLIFIVCLLMTLTGCGGGSKSPSPVLKKLEIQPATATVQKDGTREFTAVGKDQNGKAMTIKPAWSVTGGIGTVAPSTGTTTTFTATAVGEGTIVAKVGDISGSAVITVSEEEVETPPDTIRVGVDKDYTTIQEAINAAIDGVTIIVDQGRYEECIVIENKSITLKSANPDSETVVDGTIIDGNEEGSTVFINGESNHQTVTIEGFTITGGSGSGVDGFGGGVYTSFITTILRKNVISENAAQNGGGGIHARSGKLVLEENKIKANSSDNAGGGLYLKDILVATLTDNQILENTSRNNIDYTENGGGGIYANSVNGTWSGNIIKDNTAKSCGGLCLYNSAINLIDNQIIHNTADMGYGGIFVRFDYFHEMEIKDNTISENQAGSYCGGLGLSSSYVEDELELVGNTINNNLAFYGGGIYVGANVKITNNIISGNTVKPGMGGGIYVCNGKELTGSGNEFTNNQGYAIYLYESATWTNEGGNTFSGNTPDDVSP